MKNIIILFTCIAITGLYSVKAQGTLSVTVKNIQSQKGTIRVGLFSSEETFLKKASNGKVVKVEGSEMTVVFDNLKPGDYGVSVIHDENENGELDKNMMGIPSEGFAFGNNAMGTFGPPSFEKAKVSVQNKGNVTQAISLKYF
jgi:uncharacterized protein (DUF2141 family)